MTTTISGTNGVTFPDSTSMQTGQQACKAWVNFNGTGTVAIRAAYNVSSITDNGTGNYIVNFTTAMPDANYGIVATTKTGSSQSGALASLTNVSNPTASAAILLSLTPSVGLADVEYMSVAVFR